MMRLSDIAVYTKGCLIGADSWFSGVVSIDTRTLNRGDLFAAFVGTHVDAHDYLDQALHQGAIAALVTRHVASPLPQIQVDDMQRALADLASAVRAQHQVRVIGITGSNGKTTVKTLVAAILSLHGRTHVSAGNFNNEIGLPLSLLSMPMSTEYAVLEMGAGKPGDIAHLAAIARPDVGLVTLIAPAHLERMGTVEGVAKTKGALYQALPANGIAIVNADDAFADFFMQLARAHTILRFGLQCDAQISARILEQRPDASLFVLTTPIGDTEVHLPLPGQHNITNALAAAAVALALDIPLKLIVAGLEQVMPVPGRLCQIAMPAGWTLIDDSYNANPGSTSAAIEALALHAGTRYLVLGDMAELGADAHTLHAQVGAKARAYGIEKLFATGVLSAEAARAFGAGGEYFADQASLLRALHAQLHAGVTCLIKGSRSSGMDQVVSALRQNLSHPVLIGGDTSHAA